jgi:copper chaperone CopZ
VRRVIVHITGMSCEHCVRAVTDALVSHPGVQLETLRIGRAVVRYDDQVTSPAAIESVLAEAGYSATAAPAESDEAEERV